MFQSPLSAATVPIKTWERSERNHRVPVRLMRHQRISGWTFRHACPHLPYHGEPISLHPFPITIRFR